MSTNRIRDGRKSGFSSKALLLLHFRLTSIFFPFYLFLCFASHTELNLNLLKSCSAVFGFVLFSDYDCHAQIVYLEYM